MTYQIEILVKSTDSNGKAVESWKAVKPSGKDQKPYSFDSYDSANKTRHWLYPMHRVDSDRVRIVEA